MLYEVITLDDPVLPDAVADAAMQSGGFPYDKRMKKSKYQEQLLALQIELVKLLTWVQDEGERFVAVFEGRDAAGKGGTIHRVRHVITSYSIHYTKLYDNFV